MIKLSCRRFRLAVSILAVACAAMAIPSRGQPPRASSALVVLSHKQASQMILEQSQPDYPVLARVNYIQGRVRAELEVGRDGKVVQAHVLEGHAILAAAALKALRQWAYRPLETPSGPSAFLTMVEVKFALHIPQTNLVPTQAENDLSRQVRPPVVAHHPPSPSPAALVHMHLLVSDQGEVIDSDPPPRDFGNPSAAERTLQDWIFQPAHWGALPVPWYVDLDVPISTPALPRNIVEPTGR